MLPTAGLGGVLSWMEAPTEATLSLHIFAPKVLVLGLGRIAVLSGGHMILSSGELSVPQIIGPFDFQDEEVDHIFPSKPVNPVFLWINSVCQELSKIITTQVSLIRS